jgi:HSP20 family protein
MRNYNQRVAVPKVNIAENENAWTIELASPGLEKDDFKIEVKDDVLTISNEKKEEKKEDGKNYMRREFSYCSFSRSFMLPELADSEKIDAAYHNGVLEVSIPKKEAEQKKDSRVISIR